MSLTQGCPLHPPGLRPLARSGPSARSAPPPTTGDILILWPLQNGQPGPPSVWSAWHIAPLLAAASTMLHLLPPRCLPAGPARVPPELVDLTFAGFCPRLQSTGRPSRFGGCPQGLGPHTPFCAESRCTTGLVRTKVASRSVHRRRVSSPQLKLAVLCVAKRLSSFLNFEKRIALSGPWLLVSRRWRWHCAHSAESLPSLWHRCWPGASCNTLAPASHILRSICTGLLRLAATCRA